MKVFGTAFAILCGGVITAGMFFVGVVCGAAMITYNEQRKRKEKEHCNEEEN